MTSIIPILVFLYLAAKGLKVFEKTAEPRPKLLPGENTGHPNQAQQALADTPELEPHPSFEQIGQAISRFLNRYNLRYHVMDEGAAYQMCFGDDDFETRALIQIPRNGKYIHFGSLVYANIPDNAMNRVTELIARLNENQIVGSFKLNFEGRMATYEANLIRYEQQITENSFHFYLNYVIDSQTEFFPAFRRVIENEEEPILVVLDCMNQSND